MSGVTQLCLGRKQKSQVERKFDRNSARGCRADNDWALF
jgi:hypothetical protein